MFLFLEEYTIFILRSDLNRENIHIREKITLLME